MSDNGGEQAGLRDAVDAVLLDMRKDEEAGHFPGRKHYLNRILALLPVAQAESKAPEGREELRGGNLVPLIAQMIQKHPRWDGEQDVADRLAQSIVEVIGSNDARAEMYHDIVERCAQALGLSSEESWHDIPDRIRVLVEGSNESAGLREALEMWDSAWQADVIDDSTRQPELYPMLHRAAMITAGLMHPERIQQADQALAKEIERRAALSSRSDGPDGRLYFSARHILGSELERMCDEQGIARCALNYIGKLDGLGLINREKAHAFIDPLRPPPPASPQEGGKA